MLLRPRNLEFDKEPRELSPCFEKYWSSLCFKLDLLCDLKEITYLSIYYLLKLGEH